MPIFTQWLEFKNVAGKVFGQVFSAGEGFGQIGYAENGNANTNRAHQSRQYFPIRAAVQGICAYFENAGLNFSYHASATNIVTDVAVQKRVSGAGTGPFINIANNIAIAKGMCRIAPLVAISLGVGDYIEVDSYVRATEVGKYAPQTRQTITPGLGAWGGDGYVQAAYGTVNGATNRYMAWCPGAYFGLTRTKGLVAFGHSLVPLVEYYGDSGPSLAADTLNCPFIGIGRGGSQPSAWNSNGNYELAAISAKNLLALAMINQINQMSTTASVSGTTGKAVATVTGAGWTISLADSLRAPLRRFRALGLKIYIVTENYPDTGASATLMALWDGWNQWLVEDAITYYAGIVDGVIDTRPYYASTPYQSHIPLPGASTGIHDNATQIGAGIAAYFQGTGAPALVADSNNYFQVINETFYGDLGSTGALPSGWSEWVNSFAGATRYLRLDGAGHLVTQSGSTNTTYGLCTSTVLQGTNAGKEFVVRAYSAPWVTSSDQQGLHIALHATNGIGTGNDIQSSASREGYSFRFSNSGTSLVLNFKRQNSNDQGMAAETNFGATTLLNSALTAGDILSVEITRVLNGSNNNVFTIYIYRNGTQQGTVITLTDTSTPARYQNGLYLSVGTAGNTATTPPDGSGWDYVTAANFDATSISGITGPDVLYVTSGGSEPVTVNVQQSAPTVGPAVSQTVTTSLSGLGLSTVGSSGVTDNSGNAAFAGSGAIAVPASVAPGTIGSITFSCGTQNLTVPVHVLSANTGGTGGGGGDVAFSGSESASGAVNTFGSSGAWVEVPAAAGLTIRISAPHAAYSYTVSATQPVPQVIGSRLRPGEKDVITVTTKLYVRGIDAQTAYYYEY